MPISTDSFPVFTVQTYKTGFRITCGCGQLTSKGLDDTVRPFDWATTGAGLFMAMRKHESWHKSNWRNRKNAEAELASLAEAPEIVPPSDEVAEHGDKMREQDEAQAKPKPRRARAAKKGAGA